LHPELYPNWEAQLKEMKGKGIRNLVQDVSVKSIEYLGFKNYADDERDEFTVRIDANCDDTKVDKDGRIIERGASSFVEFWTFEQEKGRWLLRAVDDSCRFDPMKTPMIDEESGMPPSLRS
jgi:predicted lipid-binding transport protein (Tim44 family)